MNSCDIGVTIIKINFCDDKMQIFLGISLFMDIIMNLVLCMGIQGGVRSISDNVKVVIALDMLEFKILISFHCIQYLCTLSMFFVGKIVLFNWIYGEKDNEIDSVWYNLDIAFSVSQFES